jgi:hypothetical protein
MRFFVKRRSLEAIAVTKAIFLAFAALGLSFAPAQSAPPPGAKTSIELFDQLCIQGISRENLFYSQMAQASIRHLQPGEYAPFLPGKGVQEDFFEVRTSDAPYYATVGQVRYKNNGINCTVVHKASQQAGLLQWQNLYSSQYKNRSGSAMQFDNGRPLYFVNLGDASSVMVQFGALGEYVNYYSYSEPKKANSASNSSNENTPAASDPKAPPASSENTTRTEVPMQTESGWAYLPKAEAASPYLRLRKYAYDDTGLKNLIIFNCSKTEGNPYSNITIVFPSWFTIASFPRNSWFPSLEFRILVDRKNSYNMVGEYNNGELYFDKTPQTDKIFRSVLLADQLSIGLGAKNDEITFEFTEKVDGLMADAKAQSISKQLSAITIYSRMDGLKACEKFQTQ